MKRFSDDFIPEVFVSGQDENDREDLRSCEHLRETIEKHAKTAFLIDYPVPCPSESQAVISFSRDFTYPAFKMRSSPLGDVLSILIPFEIGHRMYLDNLVEELEDRGWKAILNDSYTDALKPPRMIPEPRGDVSLYFSYIDILNPRSCIKIPYEEIK